MQDAEAIIADEEREALRKALARLKPAAGEMATLIYWSDYRDADGRAVDGFVAGYEVGSLPRSRANWIRLRVPGIGFLPFWPRFKEREAQRLIVTFASKPLGTFALTKAD